MTDKPLLTQCLERQTKAHREWCGYLAGHCEIAYEVDDDFEHTEHINKMYLKALKEQEDHLIRLGGLDLASRYDASRFEQQGSVQVFTEDDNGTSRPVEKSISSEWQPIETAPKDGTLILGRIFFGSHTCDSYSLISWNETGWNDHPIITYKEGEEQGPTHWWPLPAISKEDA